MSNRRRRPATSASTLDTVMGLARTYQCPDCNSEIVTRHDGHLVVLEVRHDDTCPTLKRIEAQQ